MSIPEPQARRRARDVLRYVFGLAAGSIILLLLLGKRADLAAAVRQLGHLHLVWLGAAVAAEATSLWTFSYLQHQVLRLAGASIPTRALMIVSLANDAIANTAPGEPVVSSAYRYRYYRRRGASGAAAGWTIFTVLIAQTIGMSLLLLLGVVVALAGATSAADTGVTVVALAVVAMALAVLLRRDVLLRLAGALVRAVRRLTGHPRGSLGARIDATLARMREIPLSTRSTVWLFAIGTGVWFFDFLCLICAFGAVRAPVPWYGVLLAYGAAQVVGSLPLVPGGLGIEEGSLAVILAAYGAGRASSVSAALAFRLVSYWLAIAVGYASFAVIAYLARRRPARGTSGPNAHSTQSSQAKCAFAPLAAHGAPSARARAVRLVPGLECAAMEPVLADEEAVAAFARDGVVCVREVLSTAEVAVAAAAIDAVLARPGPLAQVASGADDPGAFVEDFCRWQEIPQLERLARQSRVPAVAAALLATPQLRFYHDHVLVKEAGTAQRTPWHQDQPYYNVDGRGVSAWIAVDPVPEGGSLELVAGSHRGPWLLPRTFLTQEARWFPEGSLAELPGIDAAPGAFDIRRFALQPGDAIFFDFLTVHGAPGFPYQSRRRILSLRYLAADARHAPRRWRTSPPFEGLQAELPAGAVMDHPLFPVVWPP